MSICLCIIILNNLFSWLLYRYSVCWSIRTLAHTVVYCLKTNSKKDSLPTRSRVEYNITHIYYSYACATQRCMYRLHLNYTIQYLEEDTICKQLKLFSLSLLCSNVAMNFDCFRQQKVLRYRDIIYTVPFVCMVLWRLIQCIRFDCERKRLDTFHIHTIHIHILDRIVCRIPRYFVVETIFAVFLCCYWFLAAAPNN